MVNITAYAADEYEHVCSMTFPFHRALLDREDKGVFGFTARLLNRIVGFCLAFKIDDKNMRLLSVYVHEPYRALGIGSALLRALEDRAVALSMSSLSTVLLIRDRNQPITGLLSMMGWSPPVHQFLSLKMPIQAARNAVSGAERRVDSEIEIIPWEDVQSSRLCQLRDEAWIPSDLGPWCFHGIDNRSSFAIIRRSTFEIQGWILTRALNERALAYCSSYIHPKLQPTGTILSGYMKSLVAAENAHFSTACLAVPIAYPRMLSFAERRMRPLSWDCGYIANSAKFLK